MSDARFGRYDGGERPPWLEPIEEEEQPRGPSYGKLIGLVILGLVLLGAAVGGYSWWAGRGATQGHGELIPAPPGPYKIRPTDPGGMEVEGEGDTAFAASEGAEPQGRIDVSAVPEAPIANSSGGGGAKEGGGSAIQLGAFSSEAAANAAWKALSKRFTYLEPLAFSVVKAESGDKLAQRSESQAV
ncbi:MAG TPA: SPOR domain-containing protein [Allosphingosinicella sp.]|nr:SPOR domain-containing protein [Allosphingosinicella sp.]